MFLGGIASAFEDGSVAQTLTIPVGMSTLSFALEIPSCDGFGVDTFQVSIDGSVVYSTDDLDPACGVVGYTTKTIDITAFADGGTHTLKFEGITDSFFAPTNFMVDTTSLTVCL